MSDDQNWVTPAITETRKQIADVPERVWRQIEALLRGRFSEQSLPPMGLAKVAERLIADMTPAASEAEDMP